MISKIFCFLLLFAAPAEAAVRAVATTPDVAWLLHRVGGSRVEVKSLAPSGVNYHFLTARPDYILAVNRAALVCRVGADLEIGWLPKVLEKAANAKVMNGGAGDCDLSRAVVLQEKPNGPVDRSMGDRHSAGNPHFWLSPLEMAEAAREVETRLAGVDPAGAEEFKTRRVALEAELKSLQTEMAEKLKAYKGKSFLEYHKDFYYFFRAYGLNSLGSIEEIPGVSPSPARLGKIAIEAKEKGALLALATAHDPRPDLTKFEELSGVPVATVPSSLSEPERPEAYRQWQEALVAAITSARK